MFCPIFVPYLSHICPIFVPYLDISILAQNLQLDKFEGTNFKYDNIIFKF